MCENKKCKCDPCKCEDCKCEDIEFIEKDVAIKGNLFVKEDLFVKGDLCLRGRLLEVKGVPGIPPPPSRGDPNLALSSQGVTRVFSPSQTPINGEIESFLIFMTEGLDENLVFTQDFVHQNTGKIIHLTVVPFQTFTFDNVIRITSPFLTPNDPTVKTATIFTGLAIDITVIFYNKFVALLQPTFVLFPDSPIPPPPAGLHITFS